MIRLRTGLVDKSVHTMLQALACLHRIHGKSLSLVTFKNILVIVTNGPNGSLIKIGTLELEE